MVHYVNNNLEGQKMIMIVFACLAGISTVAAALMPALTQIK
jgi:hypothetical protein